MPDRKEVMGMNVVEHKQAMSISFSCHKLDEIKELLPEIATLQKKYDVSLTISYSAGTDWSFLPPQKEDKHS